MATTNLNISVIEKRMFKETEAASYAGLPVKHFKIACRRQQDLPVLSARGRPV